MIPFYIYYSMFGFQRIGDLAWAAGDMRARGFLIGGTAGRTTLNGEGLQHEDGHSHIFSATIPNCVSYDPTFAYEVAVIVQDGLRRMYAEQEDVYYYLTVMNENYEHPAMPEGAEAGIIKGMYLFREGQGGARRKPARPAARLGTILREVIAGADLLAQDFGVAADIWSCPSFTELRREGHRGRALEPAASGPRRRASPMSRPASRAAAGRSSRRPTTCGCSPTRSAPVCPAAIRCSAPTASAAPTTARSCATSSRSTATGSRSPRSRRWPTRARSRPSVVRRRDQASTTSIRNKPDPTSTVWRRPSAENA